MDEPRSPVPPLPGRVPAGSARRAAADAPAPLGMLVAIAFLASVSNGSFFAGVFFVSADGYHFSPERNLVLGLAVGLVSVSGSRSAAAIARRVGSPRLMLRVALGLWGLAALVPMLPMLPGLPLLRADRELLLWLGALGGVACSALVWPVVESYLTAGRHGRDMRLALGSFNMAWSLATAVPLVLMPVLARWDARLSLAMGAAFNGVALLVAGRLPPRPGTHHAAEAEAALGPEYLGLMRSASWLLPASYVISSTLSPVLPHRITEVTGDAAAAGPLAGSWMLARFAALFLMWRFQGWHGRWTTLAAAASALLVGLALVLLGGTPAVLVAGLVIFGLGMGATYAAAVYYSMAVGRAAVEAGGNFEALIGLGYCGGPLLGLLGHLWSGQARAGTTTVILMGVAAALVAPGALGPYWRARAARGRARAAASD